MNGKIMGVSGSMREALIDPYTSCPREREKERERKVKRERERTKGEEREGERTAFLLLGRIRSSGEE